jgi:hypothetical protein
MCRRGTYDACQRRVDHSGHWDYLIRLCSQAPEHNAVLQKEVVGGEGKRECCCRRSEKRHRHSETDFGCHVER